MEYQFHPPTPALNAIRRLEESGFEAYLVGGCVRDYLLGLQPKDFDITSSARPEQTISVFAGEKLILTGMKHGTITVVLEGLPLEITTYRVDGDYSDSRHPDSVQFSRRLKDDASRRDFTMNAVAWSPKRGIQDFYGGIEDIQHGIIRCVGNPKLRFQEDALRILRCIRFASVLGFEIEKETGQEAIKNCEGLKQVSKERIWVELKKLLCGNNVGSCLRNYRAVIAQVIPEVRPMFDFDQRNYHHCYDLWEHTIHAVQAIEPVDYLRTAMLLHDIGKPHCFSLEEDGQGHFYGHAHLGKEMTEQILINLRTDRITREKAVALVRYHDSVIEPEKKVIRKWMSRLGSNTMKDLIRVMRADNKALSKEFQERQEGYDYIEQMIEEIEKETPCLSVKDLSVNGRDLMEIGYIGKGIGNIQRKILEAVLDGTVKNDKESILSYAKDEFAKFSK